MTVNRYAAAAGRKYQRDVMKYLRSLTHDVENLVLTGAEDEGDILLRLADRRVVLEAKRERGFHLADWVKQAEVERDNYAKHRPELLYTPNYIVVHARRNHSIGKSYVTTTLDEWLRQVW